MAVYFDNTTSPLDQLAVNLIGGLLTDAIQHGRETAQNKKLNILRSQAGSMNKTNINDTVGLFSIPEGYNSNGWQQSFHKTGSPVEQFDIGLANFAKAQKEPVSAWDLRQNVNQLSGLSRFSSLSPKLIEETFANDYANAELVRQQYLRNQAAENFAKATNPVLAAQQGVINGTIPDNVLSSVIQQNQFDRTFNDLSAYQKEQVRQADEQRALQRYMFDNPSAGQKLQNDQFYDKLNQDDMHFYRGQDDKLYEFNSELDYKRGKDIQAQSNWEKEYGSKVWNNNRDYELRKREIEYKNALIHPIEFENRISAFDYMIDKADKDIEKTYDEIKSATNEENWIEAKKQLDMLKSLKNKIIETKGNFINNFGKQSQQQNNQNIWESFLGSGGQVTSEYGMRNSKHHNGIDVFLPAGSPINMNYSGGTFTVEKAVTNKPKTGLGNYVVLSGNVNGHKVRFTFGHLQNNSINLQVGQQVNAGELLGKVGNTGYTGNSRQGFGDWYEGKSHGNHLHLGIEVDGKKIDPRKYYKKIVAV